jgi:ABC-2 type transport system ATP-binding protein
MSSIVSIHNLVKRYGDLVALDHFNLSIASGEIFGLLGPNGSGKTTAINCILQLLTYDKGDIELFGEPMTTTRYDLKRRIGVVPQQVAVFDELNVRENVDYFCSLYVGDKAERARLVDEAIAFVSLEDYTKFRPKKLSGGLLRRLNIACGIAHKPELIFFDEPTVAVDPQSRASILDGIRRLNERGSTVVYTSHYMEEVEQLCDRIYVMDHGKVIASGTNEELKDLMGSDDIVSLQTDKVSEGFIKDLRGNLKVKNADQRDGSITLMVQKDCDILSDIFEAASKNCVRLKSLDIKTPTLEDVFLYLTGRGLRD